MSHTYCHTHSAYDCQTCADEILSLGIQADKDRIAALERELERLRKKLASAEREREQSNARLHEVAVACATAERERDDAHEIIDQYKGMAARYKACMDERDELRKDAERYRWLRDDAFEHSDDCFMEAGRLFAEKHGVAFDEAIDAAIAQEGE